MMKKNSKKEKNNKRKKNNKTKKTIDRVVKIILVIIIIILLIHNCVLLRGNKKIPNGNVNIIDIKCDDNKCIGGGENPVTGGGHGHNRPVSGTDTNNTPAVGDDTTKEGTQQDSLNGDLEIVDDNITWHDSSELRIFSNSAYDYEKKIAPEDSNTYKFIIKNSTKYNLRYDIRFTEINPDNMNLKYRLKKNNKYLNDNYVSYDELGINDQLINSGDNDTYYLDWKWVSSDHDTEAGKVQANYKIKIKVEAESTNE